MLNIPAAAGGTTGHEILRGRNGFWDFVLMELQPADDLGQKVVENVAVAFVLRD